MVLPSHSGQQYEVTVPDTLDLADMAALAINGVTGPTNSEADYTVYCGKLSVDSSSRKRNYCRS